MAVDQGGSQAVELQLEFFCASSSVSSLFLLSIADALPIKAKLKQSKGDCLVEWREIHTVLLLDMHGQTHALCTRQMVQEEGLNKHRDLHLLAGRRLCVHCPLNECLLGVTGSKLI